MEIDNHNVPYSNNNLIDLSLDKGKEWIKFLFKKWVFILLFFIVGVALGINYSRMKVQMFESFLTFSLDESSNSTGGGLTSLVAQFGFGTSDNNLFSGDNIIEVVKSRTIIERVLLTQDTLNGKSITMIDYFNEVLANKNMINKKIIQLKGAFPVGLERKSCSYLQDSILYITYQNILKNYLLASRPDKQLNLYALKFSSPDERLTKVFTDKILAETINFYTELKTKKSEATLKVLEQRIGIIKGEVNKSISNKASTQDANVNTAFSAAQVPVQKQQLNMQVYSTAYGELYKNLEIARFQYLQNIPLLQVINNNDFPMEVIKPNLVKSTLTGGVVFSIIGIFLLTLLHMILVYRKK